MAEIAGVVDRESFQTWLEESSQPPSVCAVLAYRAAMRVLPVAWRYSRSRDDWSAMPLLRALLAAGVANHEMAGMAAPDGAAPLAPMLTAAGNAVAFAADAAAGYADNAAYAAAYAAETAVNDHGATVRAARGTGAAAAAVAEGAGRNLIWGYLRDDCWRVLTGSDFGRLRLFQPSIPDWHREQWAAIQEAAGPEWSFWTAWYGRALAGEPQPWPLLAEIASQDDAFWQGTDAEINARIAALAADFGARSAGAGLGAPGAGALRQALANAPNAERIVQGPAGEFDAVPVTEIDPAAFATAKRRARNIAEDMRRLSGRSNSYYPLADVIEIIETELRRSDDAPLLIYEAMMRAVRAIHTLCEANGPLSMDAHVDGFVHQLNTTALDLRLNDREVRKAVEARAAFRAQELSVEDGQHAVVLAQGLAAVSSERLGVRLVRDAAAMTGSAEAGDKSSARYQYGSTVVGMTHADKSRVTRIAEALGITGFLWSVVSWFL